MSALAKFRAVAGIDAASRVKRFQAALAASDTRRARLDEALEAAIASFRDTADVAARTAAEDAVAVEQKARDAIVQGLEAAQKELDAEQAAEAEAARQADFADRRKKLGVLSATMKADVASYIKNMGSFESLVDGLPGNERYIFWLPTLVEEVNKEVLSRQPAIHETGVVGASMRAMQTRRIVLNFDVPIEKVD